MATDGYIAFWNIHELWNQTTTNAIKPWSIKIHEMGINSCDSIIMTYERLLLVTGCDDSSLGLNVFQMSPKEDPKHLTSWYDRQHHSCQITGNILEAFRHYMFSIEQAFFIQCCLVIKSIFCLIVKVSLNWYDSFYVLRSKSKTYCHFLVLHYWLVVDFGIVLPVLSLKEIKGKCLEH
jgi:hypothetical protein